MKNTSTPPINVVGTIEDIYKISKHNNIGLQI